MISNPHYVLYYQIEQNMGIDDYYSNSVNPIKIYRDFYIDKLIGYIPSSLLLLQPINTGINKYQIIEINEANQNSEILLREIFDEFHNYGIESLETDFDMNNLVLFQQAKKYGYEYEQNDHVVSRLEIGNLQISEYYKNYDNLSASLNSKGLILVPSFLQLKNSSNFNSILEKEVNDFIMDKENISKEVLDKFQEYINSQPRKIISHVIVSDAHQIKGHALLVRSRWNKNTAILSLFQVGEREDEELKNIILGKIYLDCLCESIKLLEVNIREEVFELEKLYTPFGFQFKKLMSFNKE